MTNEEYIHLLSYAKHLLFGKKLSFNEYDLVNEAFIRVENPTGTGDFKKKIKNIYYEELSSLSLDSNTGAKPSLKVEFRACSKCHEDYPLSFYRARKDRMCKYHSTICRRCESAASLERSRRPTVDRVKRSETWRRNYLKDRNKKLRKAKEAYHSPEGKERAKKYYDANREKYLEYYKEWRKRRKVTPKTQKSF